MKNKRLNRRTFIQKSAAGVGALALSPTMLSSAVSWKGANDRIHLGHIGTGQRGTNELRHYMLPLEGSRSVAICDVFRDRREKGAALARNFYKDKAWSAPACEPYLDFKELLERKDIDAVHINTPDHWHVLCAIEAARAGKHVMLAKPLGLSYPNYLILKEELKKNDVRFHYATQQRSMKHMQLGINMIRDGKIGEVEKILVWAPGKNPVSSPVCQKVSIPEDFDFDRWTGPAPLNSYCPERVTNNSSWFQYDYSIGFLAGWGAHPLDILVWGVKEQVNGNYSCSGDGLFWSEGGMYDNIYSWDVNYIYENGLQVRFVSTDQAQESLLEHRSFMDSNGTTFYGSKGWLSLSRNSGESDIPELHKKLNAFPKDDLGRIMSEENTMGQVFLDVIHGKSGEICPLEDAIISDTLSHMGDVAIRVKRKVNWDPKKGEVTGDKEANQLYTRPMREPYTP